MIKSITKTKCIIFLEALKTSEAINYFDDGKRVINSIDEVIYNLKMWEEFKNSCQRMGMYCGSSPVIDYMERFEKEYMGVE